VPATCQPEGSQVQSAPVPLPLQPKHSGYVVKCAGSLAFVVSTISSCEHEPPTTGSTEHDARPRDAPVAEVVQSQSSASPPSTTRGCARVHEPLKLCLPLQPIKTATTTNSVCQPTDRFYLRRARPSPHARFFPDLAPHSRGAVYAAGFPVHGSLGGSSLMPDYYELVSQLGYYLFAADSSPRGPASVAFAASPDTNPGDP
jgi:hypothetical protein